jgi:8-oxo-dGTP pyrophosphatase MutT (NUDIX family)
VSAAPPLPTDWCEALQRRLVQPPLRARQPRVWQGAAIGSVEPELLEALHARVPASHALVRADGEQAVVEGASLTPVLAALADAMRVAGLAHAWRDEQLAVADADGRVLGTIERAVVRPLGIPTRAVHLVGLDPRGHHWVQQRALDKANDPGLWDTLMGGMVPAGDTLEQALERETWEEAGLALAQLRDVRRVGRLERRSPTGDVRGGYVVETIDWYSCVVPGGLEPSNRDGEVARFEVLAPAALRERLLADAFTLEAAAIFSQLHASSA